jgi:hypothetical protein
MNAPQKIETPTRRLDPKLVETLRNLTPGQKFRVTQRVRVGRRQWTTTVTGIFRNLNYLATGLATERIPEDDIIVPMLHFTKENGEHASISIDEHTLVEAM